MSTKEQLENARLLIQQKRYQDALSILETIDHPIAYKWTAKIEAILGEQDDFFYSKPHKSSNFSKTVESNKSQPLQKESASNGMNEILLVLYVAIAGIFGAMVMTLFVIWAYYVPIAWLGIGSFYGVWAMRFGIKFTKVRDGFMGAALAVLMAFLIWGGFYGMSYVYDQRDFAQEFGDGYSFQEFLEFETGQSGLIGYFLYRSTLAVEIEYRNIPVHFEGTSLLISILLDLPLSMAIIGYYAYKRTKEPFCDHKNDWVKFKRVGHVPQNTAEAFLQGIRNSNYEMTRQYLQKHVHGRSSHLTISIGECHSYALLRIETNKYDTSMEGTHKVPLNIVQKFS